MGEERLDEAASRGHCASACPIVCAHGHCHPNERRIRAVVADCVEHRVNLPPILACHDAVTALVPVQDHLPVEPLLDDEPVHLNRVGRCGGCPSHGNHSS